MRKLRVMLAARADIGYWKQTDETKYQKLRRMTQQLCMTPETGIGKPEALKHQLSGLWSRRLDKQNRLVYSFDENNVYLWQARFHYVNVPDAKQRALAIVNLNNEKM